MPLTPARFRAESGIAPNAVPLKTSRDNGTEPAVTPPPRAMPPRFAGLSATDASVAPPGGPTGTSAIATPVNGTAPTAVTVGTPPTGAVSVRSASVLVPSVVLPRATLPAGTAPSDDDGKFSSDMVASPRGDPVRSTSG